MLTSAIIKANMLIPAMKPTKKQMTKSAPSMARMEMRRRSTFACVQAGVVGEKDSWRDRENGV